MQTFLPYADFGKSLSCLDNRRLGKQRVESKQIHDTLLFGSRWRNHPAVLMWSKNIDALKLYFNISLDLWSKRGYRNIKLTPFLDIPDKIEYPNWLGNEAFHASHRSNLLRKDCKFYGKYGWSEPDNLPYIWN